MRSLDYKKWYKTKRWQKLRLQQLQKHPFCQCPHHVGMRLKATVCDHIKPHRGDPRLFWNRKNLQSLTKECHDRFKQSEEKGGAGFDKGSNEQGEPLNKNHSWYGGTDG